jgi:SpoVA protein.
LKNKINQQEYGRLVKQSNPKGNHAKNLLLAFFFGGLVCAVGEVFFELYKNLGSTAETAGILVSVTLIFISALLTALNVYDDFAIIAKAGALVPITGFANAVCAPAMEYRTEGFIAGTGTKIFAVCGPVIVYGVFASTVYGVFLMVAKLCS